MTNTNWVLSVLAHAVVILFLAGCTYILAGKLVRNKWRLLPVALSLGGLLTLVTLFTLQGHSVLFSQEATVLAKAGWLRDWLGRSDDARTDLQQRFIFVNTALNPTLINTPDANEDDLAKQVITDRHLLLKVFNYLADHRQQVGLVVCDLIFSDSTDADRPLIAAMTRLQAQNKLLLAYNHDWSRAHPYFYKELDPASFGDVTKVADESFYFSHQIVNDEMMPSLPYSMYLKLHNLQPDKNLFLSENGSWVPQNFIPEFVFTKEKALYKTAAQQPVAQLSIKVNPDTDLLKSELPNMISLGALSGEYGQLDFQDLLTSRSPRIPQIVFIGNFTDEYLDRHETAFGRLHGTTILLNEFYYILNGYHKLSIWKIAGYTLALFILLSLMIVHIVKQKVFTTLKELRGETTTHWLKFLPEWLVSMCEFIFEESHYILLFVIAALIDFAFHKMINIMGLLYFILPFSALLRFFAVKHYHQSQS